VLLVMKDGLDSVGGIDGLLALPGVAQTRAGVDRKVVVVDDQVLLSFGARTPALIDRLTEVFTEGSA
jgi:iron complex transport system substrate-binding protein